MKTTLTRNFLAVAALILLAAGSAKADTILSYQIVGPSFNAGFDISQTPPGTLIPNSPLFGFQDFMVTGVAGTVNTVPQTLTLNFYTGFLGFSGLLGDGSAPGGDFLLYGDQSLFQVINGIPTLLTGTFTLSDLLGGKYTLTATTVGAATPEPSTLLLLAVGSLTLLILKVKRVI